MAALISIVLGRPECRVPNTPAFFVAENPVSMIICPSDCCGCGFLLDDIALAAMAHQPAHVGRSRCAPDRLQALHVHARRVQKTSIDGTLERSSHRSCCVRVLEMRRSVVRTDADLNVTLVCALPMPIFQVLDYLVP